MAWQQIIPTDSTGVLGAYRASPDEQLFWRQKVWVR